MKRKICNFLVLLVIILVSCDDDGNPNHDVLNGQWYLVHVTGGFAGVDETFTANEIRWTFNKALNQLLVKNNATSSFSGYPTGTYSYSTADQGTEIECDSSRRIMIIENIDFGCYKVDADNLIIDQNGRFGADGFMFEFER